MRTYLIISLMLAGAMTMFADTYKVQSPDKRLSVNVNVGAETTYSVDFNGKTIISPSEISMTFDNGRVIGRDMKIKKAERTSVDRMLTPVIHVKSATINDKYNQLTLKSERYSLVFRVYDDGVAYRFHTDFPGNVKVMNEEATFRFPADCATLFPEETTMLSAQQPIFKKLKFSEIDADRYCSTPMMVMPDEKVRVLISESDLESFPGMFLKKQGEHELGCKHANYAVGTYKSEDREIFPNKRADYIARTKGTRDYPWRAMAIADKDADLVTNQLIYKLAPEHKGDYSWVKPGKIAWDWYNGMILRGVDFKCGVNNDTYKYFIDFASKNGIEYVVLDDGWSEPWDVTKTVPEINMPELVEYGKKRNVDLMLWVSWAPFREKLDEAMDLFRKWGIKGIKMDFMNRDDQELVDFYYEVAQKAADRKLLVDFHGAYKPTGWIRTFPNVLTSEGVAGLESHKWSSKVTPEHNLTIPFTRMVAGPMDYTPGAMRNYHKEQHVISYDHPGSIGTRCHQLGMYVAYESPLQMLADTPTAYEKEPECMEFLSKVPVTWDETRVIDAKIGEYLVVARRNGDRWYIGGLAGDNGRKVDVSLDFINGKRTLTSWTDGVNVDKDASDFRRIRKNVKQGDTITVDMYNGGGYAAVIE